MIGDNRDKYRTRKWISEHLVLFRSSTGGSLECDTCGLSALTKTELADLIGISVGTLRRFLTKGQVTRPDIADKIRNSVKAVHE